MVEAEQDLKDNSLNPTVKLDIPGESYYLTTFQEHDIADVYEILSQDSIADNLIHVPKPFTIEDAEFWVSKRISENTKLLSISYTSLLDRTHAFFTHTPVMSIPLETIRHGSPTGKFIGCISLIAHQGTDIIEMGYYLHPDHHGKRIMVIAAKAALEWAKREFGVRRVVSRADGQNARSIRVIERVSRETAVGEVRRWEKWLVWPVEKRVGKEVRSLSFNWEWEV